MKQTNLSFLFFVSLSFFVLSCEINDPIKDQSNLGQQAANIYFTPIQPIADANSEIDCEIEYWTVGNKITSQSLWDKIYLTEEYEISIKDIQYTFKNSFDTLFREKQKYKEYDFDFTDWTPDKNAYVFKTKYLVDGVYTKKTYKQNDTEKNTFASLISDNALESIYFSLINNKSLLKSILVDNSSLVTLDTFYSWYDDKGKLTPEGNNTAKTKLKSINIKDLIGDKYKKIESYLILLSFKVTNGNNEENESRSRSFKVK